MSQRAVKHVRRQLGARIRSERRELGLSQQALGKRSGLSGKFLGEVERGEKSISVDSLYRVALALRKPMAKILDERSRVRRSA